MPTRQHHANQRRRWPAADRKRLLWLACAYSGDPAMTLVLAGKFGRSPKAIRDMLRKLGWRHDQVAGRTLRQVAALLAVNEAALLALIRKGRFVPGVAYHARPAAYRIQDDDLWAWLENMRSWHYWDPACIQDGAWRTHFTELRRDWLTATQAAAILHVCTKRVLELRKTGYLPGVKPTPRAAWFRRQDVLALKANHLQGGCYIFVPRGARQPLARPGVAL